MKNYWNRFYLFLVLLSCFYNLTAQKHSSRVGIQPIFTTNQKMFAKGYRIHSCSSDNIATNIVLDRSSHICASHNNLVKPSKAIREAFNTEYQSSNKLLAAIDPNIGVNFLGNEAVTSPPDNTIAVSNDGYIVVVDNTTVEYYQTDGTNLLAWQTHFDFYGDPSINQLTFDPKIIFDNTIGRFIMVMVHGDTPDLTEILVSFSKTQNPVDGWNHYKLVGNPSHPTAYFDRPSIGVSDNELFITGNMDDPTAGNIIGNMMYQIGKQEGVNGDPALDYRIWADIPDATGDFELNLTPASEGQGAAFGQGIFMVSSKSGGGNKITYYEVTGHRNNPLTQIFTFSINVSAYSVQGDAQQLGNADLLQTNDCRVQDAFYLNGKIHYVMSFDIGSQYSGIYYGIINVVNGTNLKHSWGLSGTFDYCYPSIASFGTDPLDESVMIAFLRSGSTIYPQVCVVNFDDGNWSSSTKIVKNGVGYVDLQAGDERWGDYTGIQRMYGALNRTAWMVGCFGFGNSPNHFGTQKGWNAWVAEINDGTVGIDDYYDFSKPISVFPNPSNGLLNIELSPKIDIQGVYLLDINGKVIDKIYSDNTQSNINNHYTFNTKVYPQGLYFVKVTTSKSISYYEKVVFY